MLADLRIFRRAGRLLVGAALAVLVVASLQSVIVLRQLGYLADGYVMIYGPPLLAGEQTTRELLDLMNRSGGRELSVETDDVNDVAIGYLARPFVPEVQVVARRRGPWNVDFDLPNQPGSAPYALTAEPQLTAPKSHDVSYADGVKVLSQADHEAREPWRKRRPGPDLDPRPSRARPIDESRGVGDVGSTILRAARSGA